MSYLLSRGPKKQEQMAWLGLAFDHRAKYVKAASLFQVGGQIGDEGGQK